MIALLPTPALVAAAGFHLLLVLLGAIAVALWCRPRVWLPALALFRGEAK